MSLQATPAQLTPRERDLLEVIKDPIQFCENILQDQPWWSVQTEIARAVEKPHARVAIKGCHSSSKTYTMAQLVLWFITRYVDGIVITTAPTDRQVKDIMWGEIRKAYLRCRLRMPEPGLQELRKDIGNYAEGFTTNKSEQAVRFQGYHAPHLLFILDEAPGIPAEIMPAIEGAAAGDDVRVVMLGNPTVPGGPFYDAFTSNRAGWKSFTIDAYDTPNFEKLRELAAGDKKTMTALLAALPTEHPAIQFNPRSYLVTPQWAQERLREWGDASPMWESRVRGQFPVQAEDALISLAWLDAASAPVIVQNDEAELYCGIDVAAGGGDETVCVIRTKKGRIIECGSWYGHSTGPVIEFLRPYKGRLRNVNYDSAGPGEYFDRDLDHAGFRNLQGVNVGEASRFPDRFRNLKAELYWQLREHFKAGEVSGLTDEVMVSQLATLRFEINPRGQVEMETKDEMRKRGLKSPDRAEAVMLAFGDRTPPMITFVREQAEHFARQEATNDMKVGSAADVEKEKPKSDRFDEGWDPDELSNAYNEIQDELNRGSQKCPKCGEPLGATKTLNTDGKYYHPSCVRGW